MHPQLATLAFASATLIVASVAHAHISLDAPKSRYYQTSSAQADQNKQKAGPCGVAGGSRTTNASLVTTFKPGETITVTWRETIQHPGHFRIAFDNDGQDFPVPGNSLPSGVVVLADNIADKTSTNYTQQVTLPNLECSNCTLQLIQVMTTAPPPYAATGDLYFNCADIVLKADGGSSGTGGSPAGLGGTYANPGAGSAGKSIGQGGSVTATGGRAMATGGSTARGGSASGGTSIVSDPTTGGARVTGGFTGVGGALVNGGTPNSGGIPSTGPGGSSVVVANGGAAVGSGGSPTEGGDSPVVSGGGAISTGHGGNATAFGGTTAPAVGGVEGSAVDRSGNDSGCSCRTVQSRNIGQGVWLGLLLVAVRSRLRRRARDAH